MKRANPYAVAPTPQNVRKVGEHTHFEFAGYTYRTDSLRYVIEARQNNGWVRTYSARISTAAKEALAATE